MAARSGTADLQSAEQGLPHDARAQVHTQTQTESSSSTGQQPQGVDAEEKKKRNAISLLHLGMGRRNAAPTTTGVAPTAQAASYPPSEKVPQGTDESASGTTDEPDSYDNSTNVVTHAQDDKPGARNTASSNPYFSDARRRPVGGPQRTKSNPNEISFESPGTGGLGGTGLPRRLTFAESLMAGRPKLAKSPGLRKSLWNILTATWLNLLLPFVPVGIALHYALEGNDVVVFVINFLAIIPLAKLLGYATEEIALRVGQTLGGLLNATFGNAVELIVSIIALTKGQLGIVQSSLIGSILSNLLLVLGMCFTAGGIKFSEQGFNITSAQTSSSLLTIANIAVIIPAAFHITVDTTLSNAEELSDILKVSRGSAVMLLVLYGAFLLFQLKTHAHLYNQDEGEEEEEPSLSIYVTVGLLIADTVLVAFCAEGLVSSINGLTATGNISQSFVGLILIPIVGNAAEHVTAVTVSVKDKLDLAMGVAVGSSIQIALLVIPFLVVLGWIIGQPLTLQFDIFSTIVLFLSVILVSYCVSDAKSNWLEGCFLMLAYTIFALAAWYLPASVLEAPN